ncbi:ATP-binding protein [Nocardioides stalactiti]|uniref:ATP-binding protein n=1 Tax=Nocardioides stalactiti TaxID=2755356 RepID=UPI001603E569|nr:ATP-binding protein [Nocardioides stalactiti]
MLPNVYTPGQIPRILAGRKADLRRIEDRLARVSTYGELAGPLLVFHAPRGIGKTSLLRAAQRKADQLGFATAWTSCSRDRPVLAEVVDSVGRALERIDAVPDPTRWRGRLERVTLEVGVPGAKVQAEIARRDTPRPTAPIGALESLLHDAATMTRARGGAGLLLLIDELHAASAVDLAVILNVLQNLDGERERNPLAAVAAGLPVTPEALTRAATFGERSSFVALDLLPDEDARAALVDPAAEAGVAWTPRALSAVVEEARGYPYLLQLIGSTTWDAATPEAGTTLDMSDLRRGLPEAREQLTSMHRARWGAASALEQEFLRAMAATGLDNVTRAAIAAGMGQDSRSISVPRERLIDKGVIEPVGHGLVRFTLPGFGAFVRGLDDA